MSTCVAKSRRLPIELALILDKLSNINAGLWLRIQNKNEISKIQKTHSKQIKKYRLKELIG